MGEMNCNKNASFITGDCKKCKYSLSNKYNNNCIRFLRSVRSCVVNSDVNLKRKNPTEHLMKEPQRYFKKHQYNKR